MSSLKTQARRIIRSYTKQASRDWCGIAPSHLCAELDIGYEQACVILLALQREGMIYDNGYGNQYRITDGSMCATRFYLTGVR